MPAKAGRPQRNKPVTVPEPQEGTLCQIPEVAPLFSTYDAPKPEGAYFDEDAANHAVSWIEANVRQYQSTWAGQPLELLHWQTRLIRHIFGWMRPNGLRLFKRVYVECPRKAGKTTLASAVAQYMTLGDEEAAPETIFAATDEKQAGICYSATQMSLEQSEQLWPTLKARQVPKEISLRNNPGGVMRPVAGSARGQQGKNIHCLIFDELQEQENRRDLWDALIRSSGTRPQPLIFTISTAGWVRESICFELHEKTRLIQEGTNEDDRFLGVVYGADMEADPSDPETWRTANPSFGATVSEEAYADEWAAVKSSPAEENGFRTFQLSQWVGQNTRYLPMDEWDKGSEALPKPSKRVAFGGLDLSTTTDLTCFSVVAPNPDGSIDLYTYPFLPFDGIEDKERKDRAPYRQWAKEGFLTLTPGGVIDKSYVKAVMVDANEAFDLRDVGYDPWNATDYILERKREGFTMVEMEQSARRLSSPTKKLLELTLTAKINHGGHPVLRWSATNFAVRMDGKGNVMPAKDKAANRIDPVVSAIIAIAGWDLRGKETKRKSFYATAYEK
jgi:phage terminase large subunit-like protein